MMKFQKKYLIVAIAGSMGLGTIAAHAADFGASATVQTSLEVTVVQDFDLGTISAVETGAALTDGVAALVIDSDGVVTDPADSAAVDLTNLGTPVPAQGSVAMLADFNLIFPNTSGIDAADFAANAGTGLIADITDPNSNTVELVHESGNAAVPSLFLMHFTVGAVSGGVAAAEATPNDGRFPISQDFGETTFVFNIGATITTKPNATTAESYQEGVYAGTFEVTAEY